MVTFTQAYVKSKLEIAVCLSKSMYMERQGLDLILVVTATVASLQVTHISPERFSATLDSNLHVPSLPYSTSDESFIWNLTGHSCNGVLFTD